MDMMISNMVTQPMAEAREPVLVLKDISKSFGSVRALCSMSFDLRPGEVHVLFGENGAGKSTVINIIAGAFWPDAGSFELEGRPMRFDDVQQARRHGIAAMFQEFSLAPSLSVEENLFLGSEPSTASFIRFGERRRRTREILDRFGFNLDPSALVSSLSRAQQQMVELTKALLTNPKILILDEPTASLSERETEILFELVKRLRADGVAIIYITHRLSEIRAIGDRITVMRDGQLIKTVPADIAHGELVELMTGRPVEKLYPEVAYSPAEQLLGVEGLSTADGAVIDASIEVRAGEIVGIAGLVGCGKSEIGRALFGLVMVSSGRMTLNGKELTRLSPRRLLAEGLCYITSDRRNEGLMLLRSTKENITLSALSGPSLSRFTWIRQRAEKALATDLGQRMSLRPFDLNRNAGAYSGGNQQKILVARALARSAKIFIFDEPTVGVDVSARLEMYGFMKQLVENGSAVVIISSDLPEVMNMSHRLYVVRGGRIVDHIQKSDINERRILEGFFDAKEHDHE